MLVFCKAKNEWGKDCRIPLVKVDLCGNQHLYTRIESIYRRLRMAGTQIEVICVSPLSDIPTLTSVMLLLFEVGSC